MSNPLTLSFSTLLKEFQSLILLCLGPAFESAS